MAVFRPANSKPDADIRRGLIECKIANVDHHFGLVPTLVTAHTFCASRDTWVSYGWCLLIRRKQNLASVLGIQKENWG